MYVADPQLSKEKIDVHLDIFVKNMQCKCENLN